MYNHIPSSFWIPLGASLGLFCWTSCFHRRRRRRKLWWDLASLYQNRKKTEGDVMKVDGDGWRAFQKSWAFPHRSPFWSKFIYKIVDFEHFSMLFIEGSRSIYDMRFQSWPATKWLLKIQKHTNGELDRLGWGFPEFCLKTMSILWHSVYLCIRSCVRMSWDVNIDRCILPKKRTY